MIKTNGDIAIEVRRYQEIGERNGKTATVIIQYN